MPFRCRQKMTIYPAGSIEFESLVPNPDTCICEVRSMPQQRKLPDVDMTDLAASLKAGVNLQQVNCKLVNGNSAVQSLNAALSKASKKVSNKFRR